MFKTIKIIKELSIVLLPLEQIKQIEIFTAGIMSEDEMTLWCGIFKKNSHLTKLNFR